MQRTGYGFADETYGLPQGRAVRPTAAPEWALAEAYHASPIGEGGVAWVPGAADVTVGGGYYGGPILDRCPTMYSDAPPRTARGVEDGVVMGRIKQTYWEVDGARYSTAAEALDAAEGVVHCSRGAPVGEGGGSCNPTAGGMAQALDTTGGLAAGKICCGPAIEAGNTSHHLAAGRTAHALGAADGAMQATHYGRRPVKVGAAMRNPGGLRRSASRGKGAKQSRLELKFEENMAELRSNAAKRVPCPTCCRKFDPHRIAQHREVCGKYTKRLGAGMRMVGRDAAPDYESPASDDDSQDPMKDFGPAHFVVREPYPISEDDFIRGLHPHAASAAATMLGVQPPSYYSTDAVHPAHEFAAPHVRQGYDSLAFTTVRPSQAYSAAPATSVETTWL